MSTTIQISDEQREELESLKQVPDESLKSVLQRLIDGYDDTTGLDESDVERIVEREIEQLKREMR